MRELSAGTNIIYKALWLLEEGRGRKVAATVRVLMTAASCHQKHSSELFIKDRGKAGGEWDADRWMLRGVELRHEKSRFYGASVSEQFPDSNVSARGWELKCFVQFGINQSRGKGFLGRYLHTSVHSWMTAANLRAAEGWLGGEVREYSLGNDPAQPLCHCSWLVGFEEKQLLDPWR